jgi:hypothetical protein
MDQAYIDRVLHGKQYSTSTKQKTQRLKSPNVLTADLSRESCSRRGEAYHGS